VGTYRAQTQQKGATVMKGSKDCMTMEHNCCFQYDAQHALHSSTMPPTYRLHWSFMHAGMILSWSGGSGL
jgi:hypothetical protein